MKTYIYKCHGCGKLYYFKENRREVQPPSNQIRLEDFFCFNCGSSWDHRFDLVGIKPPSKFFNNLITWIFRFLRKNCRWGKGTK